MKKLSELVTGDSVKIHCTITGKNYIRTITRTTKTQIVTEFETSTGIHESKHNKNTGYNVGYDNHTLMLSITEDDVIIDLSDIEEAEEVEQVKTWTLSDQMCSKLRVKKLTYKFNVYKTMLLDYVKRNDRIGLYQKGYINIMNNCLTMIEQENKIYNL